MGWGGRGRWPGHGPFSYLPPWQRPGWVYGRGACWWLPASYLQTAIPPTVPEPTSVPQMVPATPFMPALTKEQEVQVLEQQMGFLQSRLDAIKNRLEELGR